MKRTETREGQRRFPAIITCLVIFYCTHENVFSKEPLTELDKLSRPLFETPTPTPMKKEHPDIHISSQNQSGGFTGYNTGTVNLGPPQRVLAAAQSTSMTQILSTAPKGRVDVMAVNGDTETLAFAAEIHRLLSAAGYNVGPNVSTMVQAGDPLPQLAFAVSGKKTDEFTSPLFSALRQLDPNTVLLGNPPHLPPMIVVSPNR